MDQSTIIKDAYFLVMNLVINPNDITKIECNLNNFDPVIIRIKTDHYVISCISNLLLISNINKYSSVIDLFNNVPLAEMKYFRSVASVC